MDDAIRKAETLIEAGGHIRMFRDKLTVLKLGGSAMEDPAALEATLQDVVFMETVGLRPILVHGGGKAIDRATASAGLQIGKGDSVEWHSVRRKTREPAAPSKGEPLVLAWRCGLAAHESCLEVVSKPPVGADVHLLSLGFSQANPRRRGFEMAS